MQVKIYRKTGKRGPSKRDERSIQERITQVTVMRDVFLRNNHKMTKRSRDKGRQEVQEMQKDKKVINMISLYHSKTTDIITMLSDSILPEKKDT